MINFDLADICVFSPEGSLTLFGVYMHYKEYIYDNYGWLANSTRKHHEDRILRIIDSVVPNHNDTAISQYPPDFPDQVYTEMKRRGKQGSGEPYEEQTLLQFRFLVRVIMEVAKTHYLLQDTLALTEQSQNTISIDSPSIPTVRRYLRPDEELSIIKALIPHLSDEGEARLVLMQMATGLRENECCGLNWSMIRQDPDSEACKVMIAQTTSVGSNTLKLGGKSKNAPRTIILSSLVYDFLIDAKKHLLARWIAAGNSPEAFENLPFGCKGVNLKTRASTRDMTDYANQLLYHIGIRNNELATLSANLVAEYHDLQERGLYADINDYRSPTCYLLRRAYATHLIALQVNASERQYSMGHRIDDPSVDKRIFTNSNMQDQLQRKLSKRPLLNPLDPDEYVLDVSHPVTIRSNEEVVVVPPGASNVFLDIRTDEPGDCIEISIEHNGGTNHTYTLITRQVSWAPDPYANPYPCNVNVLHFYHTMYAKEIESFKLWLQTLQEKK